MVEINEDSDKHMEMCDLIVETLRQHPSSARVTIAEEVKNPYGYSQSYLKENFIPSALKHLKKNNRIEEDRRVPEGGRDKIYWKVKNNANSSSY